MRLLLLLLALSAAPAFAQPASPVGLWRTIDEAGVARSVVRIFEAQGALYGRVETVLDPAKAGVLCSKCPGDRKDKPLLGLDFMRGLKPAEDGGWSGGEILDPETGSTYRASMRLADGGTKLVVRGYVGIPALGRSQTWIRAN